MGPGQSPVMCDTTSEGQETRAMSRSFTDVIIRGVETLRSLDPGLQRFGASAHRYAFNPPLSEGAIAEVESQYRITLAPDYRSFLRDVGNGGAGPCPGPASQVTSYAVRKLLMPKAPANSSLNEPRTRLPGSGPRSAQQSVSR
jgi:hypothetical protein